MTITILTEAEIRSCVDLNEEALSVVADGFTSLAAGEVSLPPIVRVDVPEHKGEVDIKTAYIRGLDSFAIKIADSRQPTRFWLIRSASVVPSTSCETM